MRQIFFTPGPSQLYPTVPRHLKKAIQDGVCSISHRSFRFEAIFTRTTQSIKTLLNMPVDWEIFFLGSGTEVMERVIQNCVAKHSFHLVNGAFSLRFWEIAQELKKAPVKLEVEWGLGFELAQIKVPARSELICVTQNETSTGAALEPALIYQLRKRYPEKLIAVDIVSAAPYVALDWAQIDCAFFSVHKGFGLPAGLAVVLVNQRCLEKARFLAGHGYNIGSFHSFSSLAQKAVKRQTPETPNVLGIYLLGCVSSDLQQQGLAVVRKNTEQKAKILYNFFEQQTGFTPLVKRAVWRSPTVIVIEVAGGGASVIKRCSENGFIIGAGYGEFKDKHIRLANFPAHRKAEVARLVECLT